MFLHISQELKVHGLGDETGTTAKSNCGLMLGGGGVQARPPILPNHFASDTAVNKALIIRI